MSDVSPWPTATSASRNPRPTLLVACGAAFIAFLDLSVVNIAFPALGRDFPATTASALTWVVSGYAVAFAALLTPAGRLADLLGRRRVFLAALTGFALTSLLCAIAPDPGWLIAGRFLQGATAGLMIPAGLGLVLAVTAPTRIGTAIAAWTVSGGFAATVGPAVGGGLVELFGWRSVFAVNVPIVAVLVAVGLARIDTDRPRTDAHLPDLMGITATAVGIGAIVAAITEGHDWGWTSRPTLTAAGIGAFLLAVAVTRSRRHRSPAIAIGLWRSRHYALANAAAFAFGAGMFAWLLAGQLFLDTIWRYSVLESAGAMTFGAVTAMVTATVTGRLPPDRRRVAGVLGALMFAVAALWMSTDAFGPDPALWTAWVPAGILGGGGIGIAVTVIGSAAATALPPHEFASGVGMNLTARQAGGAIGVAVLAATFAAQSDQLAAFHILFAACAAIATVAAAVLAASTSTRETVR